nr:hypothetical protein [Ensifer canadensis]
MFAYWRSDQWQEAWGLAAIIVVLTALSAIASVWFAEASGELVSAIAFLHHPENPTTLQKILESAASLATIVVVREVGFTAFRHFFSTTLHRKWRAWLDRRFNDALLDSNHTHFHLQQGAAEAVPTKAAVPDNIDQRIQESIKGMTGGAIGLAMGVAGVVLSLFFVGGKIIETSTEVSGLEFLGSYGSACLTVAAVVAYVPISISSLSTTSSARASSPTRPDCSRTSKTGSAYRPTLPAPSWPTQSSTIARGSYTSCRT